MTIKSLNLAISLLVGWCYLQRINIINASNSTHHRNIVPQVLGYEVWVYFALIVLPVLYVWIRCHVRIKVSYAMFRTSANAQSFVIQLHAYKGWHSHMMFYSLLFCAITACSGVVPLPDSYSLVGVKVHDITFIYSSLVNLLGFV